MSVVPEPHRLRKLWIVLFLVLVTAVVIAAFIPAERTLKGACIVEPSRTWTLSELR